MEKKDVSFKTTNKTIAQLVDYCDSQCSIDVMLEQRENSKGVTFWKPVYHCTLSTPEIKTQVFQDYSNTEGVVLKPRRLNDSLYNIERLERTAYRDKKYTKEESANE